MLILFQWVWHRALGSEVLTSYQKMQMLLDSRPYVEQQGSRLVLKLQHPSESPGGLIKAQIAAPTKVSDSYDHRGRHWTDVAPSKEMLAATRSSKRQKNDSPLEPALESSSTNTVSLEWCLIICMSNKYISDNDATDFRTTFCTLRSRPYSWGCIIIEKSVSFRTQILTFLKLFGDFWQTANFQNLDFLFSNLLESSGKH